MGTIGSQYMAYVGGIPHPRCQWNIIICSFLWSAPYKPSPQVHIDLRDLPQNVFRNADTKGPFLPPQPRSSAGLCSAELVCIRDGAELGTYLGTKNPPNPTLTGARWYGDGGWTGEPWTTGCGMRWDEFLCLFLKGVFFIWVSFQKKEKVVRKSEDNLIRYLQSMTWFMNLKARIRGHLDGFWSWDDQCFQPKLRKVGMP